VPGVGHADPGEGDLELVEHLHRGVEANRFIVDLGLLRVRAHQDPARVLACHFVGDRRRARVVGVIDDRHHHLESWNASVVVATRTMKTETTGMTASVKSTANSPVSTAPRGRRRHDWEQGDAEQQARASGEVEPAPPAPETDPGAGDTPPPGEAAVGHEVELQGRDRLDRVGHAGGAPERDEQLQQPVAGERDGTASTPR
jgi:hypothetical protein